MILPNLTEEELALYELLKTNNWRLEQEEMRNYVDIFFDEFVSSP
jgi:hypothetical protein